jgi:hypothetical protein
LGAPDETARFVNDFSDLNRGEKMKSQPDTKRGALKTVDDDSGQDMTRQLGDSAMYKLYAKSVGWPTLTSIAIMMVISAFATTFPSMLSPLSRNFR